MKKIVLYLMFVLTPSLAFAGTWCKWDGSAGIDCQSTNRTFILAADGHRITISAENLNPRGWYELTVTQPIIGADQTKDAVVWDLVGNQMSKTWTVRDLTPEEIDNRIASPMSVNDYYVWRTLLETGVITIQQAQTYLPQELIDAYQARKRLLNP